VTNGRFDAVAARNAVLCHDDLEDPKMRQNVS
jgi:hypothetical protein